MILFKKRLRKLRKDMNMTQQELAEELNIARSTVSSYEIGDREPEFETLEVIADYFNVDIDYLLGRTDNKRTYTFIDDNDSSLSDAVNIIMFKKNHVLNKLIIKISKLSNEEIEALSKLLK